MAVIRPCKSDSFCRDNGTARGARAVCVANRMTGKLISVANLLERNDHTRWSATIVSNTLQGCLAKLNEHATSTYRKKCGGLPNAFEKSIQCGGIGGYLHITPVILQLGFCGVDLRGCDITCVMLIQLGIVGLECDALGAKRGVFEKNIFCRRVGGSCGKLLKAGLDDYSTYFLISLERIWY